MPMKTFKIGFRDNNSEFRKGNDWKDVLLSWIQAGYLFSGPDFFRSGFDLSKLTAREVVSSAPGYPLKYGDPHSLAREDVVKAKGFSPYSNNPEWWEKKAGIYGVKVPEWFKVLGNSRANSCHSTNSIVAKAMNAVARNGYVKLYAKAGGTATVYEGDKVEYDGKVYTAKALGSPSMDSATLVDDAGNKLVVKMKDYKLKAVNAKFKVGDKVKGTMGASPMGVITKIEKSDSWLGNICTVKWEDGTTTHPGEGQLMLANSVRSRNAVVQKALNAVSRNAVAYTNPETSDKVVIKPFAGLWDVRVVPPYFHNLFTAKTKDEAVAWAKANGKTITKIENAVAKNATRARNAEDDFLQYYADSYSYIPKVGEIYKYDGKRVKCTSVQKLQRGNDDRDRFLVEGRVVG